MRNRWPSLPRPDITTPPGWSHSLIASIGRPRSHSISPDGNQLAFFWDRDDRSDLYVMARNNRWPSRLTMERDPRPYWFDEPPQWSPDGSRIVFVDQGYIWVVPVSGGLPLKVMNFTEGAASPRWMPDNQHILATYDKGEHTNILLIDTNGGWPREVSKLIGRDHSPEASPDGSKVVFAHRPLHDLERTDIVLVNLIDNKASPLTDTSGHINRSPRWSPDGKKIAFTSNRTGFYELFILFLESDQEIQFTKGGYDLDEISWSPDGTRILCTINRGGAIDLGIMHTEPGEWQNLRTAYGFHARPQWLPGGKTITFEYDDPQHPPDIYQMDIDSQRVTQLSFSTPPAFASLDFVVPEQVGYKSFDGVEIPSYIYYPNNPNGAALVNPHGGPTAQYALEWDIWAQYMTAKGYTVLAPNFRGSTGYGVEFERLNYNVWGVDDTRDCLAGADFLTTLEGIDSQRIGILGASYGGYLAICSLAFDPGYRYRCGVVKYGDCNLLTSWALCDRSGQEDLYRMMGNPSDQRAAYKKGSPIWKVKDIQVPVLIFHGLKDPYVPAHQSEELVEALLKEDKTFEYRTYPDEGHGIFRHNNLIDYYQRMERFLDWYLL